MTVLNIVVADPKKLLIAGSGIGGLATALAFARIGWRVELFERAGEFKELGAGVQIGPNGMKVLHALGLSDAIAKVGFETTGIEMRLGESGRRLFHMPLRGVVKPRWGAEYYHLHRADLLDVLLQAAKARPNISLHRNATVTGYETTSPGAGLTLEDGKSTTGDFVVAADGVRSALRDQMLGPQALRFAGTYAWRALVPISELPGLDIPTTACVWALPGKHALTTRVRGGEVVNFVGVVEGDAPDANSWRVEGDRADVAQDFGGINPLLDAVIAKMDTVYRWALADLAPLPRWSDGRVALLGDAAHPMVPSLAQGAVQALEDAMILSRCAEATPPEKLGAHYHKIRAARVAKVQNQSRGNMRMFHRAGLARALHYPPIWIGSSFLPRVVQQRYDWLYGYDPVTAPI